MPELVYNVKFQIDTDFKEGAPSITAYKERAEELEAQIKALTGAQEDFNRSAKKTGSQVGQMNKQVSVGNQLFFSLSDGIQDATQFSYGFGTGMRAVGNNIGFTAELAGTFIQRVKEMNGGVLTTTGLLKGLSGSFLGVGGVIFLINTAITLFTTYALRQEKAAKSTADFAKETNSLVSALQSLGAFKDDPFGVERTSVALSDVNTRLREAQESLFTPEEESRLNELMRERSSIAIGIGTAMEAQQRAKVATLDAEIESLQARREASVTEEKLQALKEKQAELEVELELAISTANDERVKALMLENKINEEKQKQIENELKIFEQREQMYYMDLQMQQLIDEARINNENERLRLEQERRALIENPPQIVRQDDNESKFIREALRNEQELQDSKQRTAQMTLEAGLAQFFSNKELAIATALVDTYVAAQKAYASQLVIGDPTSLARAQQAAFLAVAQGLARVALLKSIQPNGSGAGGGGNTVSSGAFGFRSTNVDGQQTFRTPSFMPSGQESQPKVFIANKVVADRKQLYVLNKLGEEEYRQIKV